MKKYNKNIKLLSLNDRYQTIRFFGNYKYLRMGTYYNELYRHTLSYSAHYKYNKMLHNFRKSNSISKIIYKKGKCIHDYL